ncbi:transposase [Actinoplanes sp. NBRC 103695]|uniref:transposase n=1 Tax=Actinoplanes sp. NBRC 103695 TaxID=3032202 RepID=UPI0025555752|nr:transposase [Actinoplanes sp. NBRC 103695]
MAQVEGRSTAAVTGWLEQRPLAWREQVNAVAIDMCMVFKSAIRQVLPHALLVVDQFLVCSWPTGPSPRSAAGRPPPVAGAAAVRVIRNGGCVTG